MCDAWDRTPSDVNPPADVREQFARFVEARNKWNNAKVTDLAEYREAKRREENPTIGDILDRQRLAQQQLAHDLANAFRSMELAPRDEGDA